MLILVTGSRGWERSGLIAKRLCELAEEEPFTLLSGNARGADEQAERIAEILECPVIRMPVTDEDWREHGKAAGARRNNAMLSLHPDKVLVFWDGTSRGTRQCMQEALKKRFNVEIYLHGVLQ